VNWSKDNNALNKGEVRAMAWHDVGHGADAVSYWQWRSALNGQEEYHGTLVGADGTPVPLYDEVAQIGREFEKAGPALSGTEPHSEVALLHSYDSRWAINWQRHNQAFDPKEALFSYYGPLRALVHSVDIVSPSVSLSQYKLVVAPALNLLTDAQADNLMDYVRSGGHLVLGQRSAMKNDDNGLQPERQPGPLAGMLGGRVEQFYALDQDVPVTGEWGSGSGKIWAEQLSVKDSQAHVLMRYGKSNGWLDGQPAAITRVVGKGSITYIGAWLDEKTMNAAAKWMIETSGIPSSTIELPKGVDLYVRSQKGASGDQKTIWILINFGKDTATVSLPGQMMDVLGGGGHVGSVKLEPYGVSVLSK
jgi:beta-galactosidase